jgi:hypothetical protein
VITRASVGASHWCCQYGRLHASPAAGGYPGQGGSRDRRTWRQPGGENRPPQHDAGGEELPARPALELGETRARGDQYSLPENQGATAQRLAAQYQVSRQTIERDGTFAEAVDTLEEEVRTDLRLSMALQGDFECRAGGIKAVNLVPMLGQLRSGRGTLLRGPHLKQRLGPAARARRARRS